MGKERYVYSQFDKNYMIFDNVFLHCYLEKGFEYHIACECHVENTTFYRYVWNINNGYNTVESIEKEIKQFIEYIKESLCFQLKFC